MLCGAPAARAGCPVTLDGETELIGTLRSEIAAFSDDGTPCVALSARCWRNGDQLEVAVSDASGRSAQRAFASSSGAAAFIVAWSLHPATDAPAAQRPALSTVTVGAVSPGRSLHPEVALGYLDATGADQGWVTLTASLEQRIEHLRFGGGLRGLTGNDTSVANVDLELRAGVIWDLPARWSVRAELAGAKTIFSRYSDMFTEQGYGAVGWRGGLRALLGWQLEGPLGLEVGAGYDWLRAVSSDDTGNLGHGNALGFWKLELGVRWVP
ncbi:MAG TPA: hypothetical protein VLM79_35035 [Kofleriaceae bacterium]|nr:hypothetical protein [Kofleriaceae bacterium]